jgi:hypothetical protein
MGPIVDRSREMLGPADKAIIQARKLLREAVKDVEAGRSPNGTGTSYYTVRPARTSSPATPTGTGRWRRTSRRTGFCRRCRRIGSSSLVSSTGAEGLRGGYAHQFEGTPETIRLPDLFSRTGDSAVRSGSPASLGA